MKKKPTLALLICGDRAWRSVTIIDRELKALQEEYDIRIVIEGECRGADRLGGLVAQSLMIPVDKNPANWDKHGKAAGPIRNELQLKKLLKHRASEKLALAFHKDLSKSKGTKNMVKLLRNAGIEVKVISK